MAAGGWCALAFSVFLPFLCQLSHGAIDFIVSPQSTAVLLGSDLILDCVAVDTPQSRPVSYQWEFDDVAIYTQIPRASIFTNNSLFVPGLTQQDLGDYVCVAQVLIDPTSIIKTEPATVIKAYIDEFVIHPSSVVITEGSTVSLTCVTGNSAPPAQISWLKDGEVFIAGTQQIGTFGTIGVGGASQRTAQLEFTAAVEFDGIYQCQATNELLQESAWSEESNITVYRLPVAPEFTIRPESIIAPADQSFIFMCAASGYPEPTYDWLKDGQAVMLDTRIHQDGNGSLYFSYLDVANDTGVYECAATNSEGTITAEPAQLTVAYLDLQFEAWPSDMTATAGQAITLPCEPPDSVPAAQVLWYKDSGILELRSGDFAITLINGDLHFSSVQLNDVGVYVCVAVNNYSVPSTRSSAAASLMVQAAPLLLEPPIPTTVIKGDLFTLYCLVDGDPFPSVAWFKDGLLLQPSSKISFSNLNQELIVSNANILDGGLYNCEATNSLGSVSSQLVTVTIIVPPEIVEPMEDLAVPEGTSAILSCVVYGDPVPAVTWYKDDIPVTYSSSVFANTSGLVILSVQTRHEGTYRCEATNSGGTKSSEGILQIQVDPSIDIAPEDQTVVRGRSVIFQCAASGQPQPTYIWMYNSSSSLPAGVSVSNTGAALILTSAQPEHAGIYTCVASSSVGEDLASATLHVQVPPVVVAITGNPTVNQGSDLQLSCEVTGNPSPVILWQFNSMLLIPTADSRISFPSASSLQVRFMTATDAGQYKCVAENAAGVDSKVVAVVVRQTPLPPILISVHAVSMTSINVIWEAPVPDASRDITGYVIQYKESSAVDFTHYDHRIPASSTSYEVGGLQPYTFYAFRVAAENDIGVGEYSAILEQRTLETVHVHAGVVSMSQSLPLSDRMRRQAVQLNNTSLLAPSEPRNLQLMSHNSTAIALQWEVPEQTNGQIRTYQLFHRAKFSNDEFSVIEILVPSIPLQYYTLGGLTPYTTYEFKVRGATIENEETLWGAFSNLLDVTTAPEVPSSGPGNTHGLALSPYALQISWQALQEDSQNGPLTGYRIKYRQSNSNMPYYMVNVDSSTLQVNLTNLSPWQWYDITVYAYNVMGESVQGSPLTIRTLPIAPGASPVNLQALAISATVIMASWQPVPEDQRNSDISGYILEYTADGGVINSASVGNPDILELDVSDLTPYTVYELRIRAFTTQVQDGFSPYSNLVTVTTMEGVPGPVVGLTASAVPYGMALSWDPPTAPNGIIRAYHVTYSVAREEEDTGRSQGIPDTVGDDDSSLPGELASLNATTVQTTDTNITITGLHPDLQYSFSVAAETGAGVGSVPATIASVTSLTTSLPSTLASDEITAVEALTTTPLSAVESTTAAEDLPDDDNMVLIIAAAAAGGVALFLLIILVVVLCHHRRKKKRGIYYDQKNKVIPPMAFKRQSIADLSENEFNMQQARRHTRSSSSGTYRSTTAQSDVHSTTESLDSPDLVATGNQANGHPKIPVARQLDAASLNELHLANIPDDWLRDIIRPGQPISGLDNPAFEPESRGVHSDLPGGRNHFTRPPYTSATELFEQVNVSKRHRNRMKSESAAAIAALKNRDTSVFNDTDMLIDDSETVVVYNERTAL